MLSKIEFDILVFLAENSGNYTQREICTKINVSLGSVNKALNNLQKNNLLYGLKITNKGYLALEPFKVKRAIFIAAGFGSRLVPLTFNTPKPLIRVFGKRMIEYSIEVLNEIGIEEIIIVRGYLGEQFDVLLNKYPKIKFIDNPIYNESNNISSAMQVKDLFSNSYVLDADLVLKNKNLITKYQYATNYLGVYSNKTDDWCLNISKGYIKSMELGGKDCYQMVGISYWTEEDGKKLAKDIPYVYNMPGGKERYWDQVALEYCIDNYKVSVRPCKQEDIVEIDSFSDLKKIDKTYDV